MKKSDEEIKGMFEVLAGHFAELLFVCFTRVIENSEENIKPFDAVYETLKYAVVELEKSKNDFKIGDLDRSRLCQDYTTIQ